MASAIPEAGENPLTPRYWTGQLDLRPVAAFRIALGAFLLFDLAELLPDLSARFTDAGVFPLALFEESWARAPLWVPFDSFHTPLLAHLYLAIAALFAVALMVGFGGRAVLFANFVLMAGFQERLPPLFDRSDTVLRLMLFWLAFTRASEVWSVDAWRARAERRPLATSGPALPIRLLQLQIGWIYLCSVFFKARGTTWHDGTAVSYVLRVPHVFSRGGLEGFAEWGPAIAALTLGTLAIEASFLFLTHSPVAHRKLKALGLLLGASMHVGIFAATNIGHFSYLMLLTYLPMLEAEWVQAAVDRLGALPQRLESLTRAACESLPARLLFAFVPLPSPSNGKLRGESLLFAWFLVVSLTSAPSSWSRPPLLDRGVAALSLWSNWDMFSPDPLDEDHLFAAEVERAEGVVEPVQGPGGPGLRGPLFSRWFKYFDNLSRLGAEPLRQGWAQYVCRAEAVRTGALPRVVRLRGLRQRVPPVGQPYPPVEALLLWEERCGAAPAEAAR